MKTRSIRQRGSSLVEVLLAATTTVLVLTGAIGTFVMCSKTWLQGESRIAVQGDVSSAIRTISKELREAREVAVDANGNGLTYKKPAKTAGGDYIMPLVWDNVTRRIELNGTSLRITANGSPDRTICKGLRLTDPSSPGGSTPITIFTAGAGISPRSITIMLVPQRNGLAGAKDNARLRETIFLRNMVEVTK